ncbi:protein-export chaperone SecB [Flavobacterium hydatis]|uniref:Preprotein translocase subunit SecB n=1 Tax=Flavobacterium hydatis TaxID=991 RepID=A0A086AKX8_FLAHY|nr:protein-export chaperone SecB [Flavobacterium hydatis]KFF17342.1 hypothetical protein IW20_08345 [Flavobacterium hydatis]OXA95175.1 hypothetical protein B0A62_09760 [Flavobacterium hydatis]
MIKGNTTTAFKFVKFRVSNFSFDEPEKENDGYDIKFSPKGKYNENEGSYELTVNFKAYDKQNSKKLIINVNSVSHFKFEKPCKFDQLPSHFFTNSIPIIFPYLRAFVSTLTLQANSRILMLGLINFTNMAEPLKENTEIINN